MPLVDGSAKGNRRASALLPAVMNYGKANNKLLAPLSLPLISPIITLTVYQQSLTVSQGGPASSCNSFRVANESNAVAWRKASGDGRPVPE